MCPILNSRFSYRCNETIVVTYEAVQVLVRLVDSSGRAFRSEPRRSIDSLSQYMSGRLRGRNNGLLRRVHHTTRI